MGPPKFHGLVGYTMIFILMHLQLVILTFLIHQTDKPESETGDFQGTSRENEDMLENQTGYSSDNSIVDRDYVPDKEPSDSDDSSDSDIPLQVLKRKLPIGSDEKKEQNKRSDESKNQDKQPKKRRLDGPYTRKKRKERTENRNTGQSYVTAKGKEVRKREMKTLPISRKKCRERLVEDVRQGIFNEYWGLGARDKRVIYIADHSETKETVVKRKRTDDPSKSRNRQVSHSFYFKINGEKIKVCRGCFMKILDETQMFITIALDNSQLSLSGVVQPDKRGRHEPKNKHSQKMIQEAIHHIESFPGYQSHYTRRTNDKKYLAPYLTLQKMYELYCKNRKEKVSRRIYEKEFHKLKLTFKKPKVDTCHKCDVLQMRLKVAEENEKETIQTEIDVHLIEADNVYKQKDADKTFAKQNETTKCYSFDLQQCLPTPFVNSSVAFYKRQLWTYNTS